MKVLFVGQQNFNNKNGGSLVSKNNFEALKKCGFIVEKYFLIEKINIFSKLLKFFNLVVFKSFFLKSKQKDLLFKIKEEHYDVIYLDSSLTGNLSKNIKKLNPKIKIITFFHNIEYNYFYDRKKIERNGLNFFINNLFLYAAKYQENLSILNSDNIILLNEREKKEIFKIYDNVDEKKINILPIALEDKFDCFYEKIDKEKKLLFVGSYFYPNIEGIRWFCKEVMPNINYKLEIVGKGMEILKNELEKYSINIQVIGEVKDLSEYYCSSDIVIAPIFSGSGMKTKTIEALMFGKYILGTDEAFQGIQINNEIGIKCNTNLEFINSLNKIWNLEIKKFRKESRDLYLKEYSLEVRTKKLKKILMK